MPRLPEWRRAFCEKVLSSYGGVLLTASLDESIAFVNEYAPEHLEVLVAEPFSILGRLKNFGESFSRDGMDAPLVKKISVRPSLL